MSGFGRIPRPHGLASAAPMGDAPTPATDAGASLRPSPSEALGPATPGAAPLARNPWFAVVVAVAALALAHELLAPVALAGLLACLIVPLVRALERLHVPRGVAAVLSTLTLVAAALGLVMLLANEIADVSKSFPEYQDTIRRKIDALAGAPLAAPVAAAKKRLDELEQAVPRTPPPAEATPPVPVEIVTREPTALEALRDNLVPALPGVGHGVVVLLLCAFLVGFRQELRVRFLRLASLADIAVTSQALDEAVARIGRYLAAALLVNLVFGLAIAAGLSLIGVPNAALCGAVAAASRFVPVIGVWIGMLFPLGISFAAVPGWGATAGTLGLFLGAELVTANVFEPVVFGKTTGISPLAVVLATVFWTWLWGPLGLLLAVPLTLCLAVAGRTAPSLRFLDVLVGADEPLPLPDRLYERLLAGDARGARAVLGEAAKALGPERAVEDVLFAALSTGAADHRRGRLDAHRLEVACQAAEEAHEEWAETFAPATGAGAGDSGAAGDEGVAGTEGPTVLVAPANGRADAATAEVLRAHLAARGVAARVAPSGTLSGEWPRVVAEAMPSVVVVVALPPSGPLVLRHIARRLRPAVARGRLLAAPWVAGGASAASEDLDALGRTVDGVSEHFGEIADHVRALCAGPRAAAPVATREGVP